MPIINRRHFIVSGTSAVSVGLVGNTATAAGHADHIVTIESFAFSPAKLTIKTGETVAFVNQDRARHTATADDGSFDTGRLKRNERVEITFDSAGTFSYFCAVHPNMKAQITIV